MEEALWLPSALTQSEEKESAESGRAPRRL